MPRTTSDPKRRRGTKNLRIGRSQRDSQLLDEEVDESKNKTVWDIYTEYSRKVDQERIRDWNDTLNTLLVFAALYSAVLTAFIIQSLTLIQEDTPGTTRDILLHISNQLAKNLSDSFSSTPFIAPQWALGVNYCFFISLCFSLVTALAAVLALQWVGSYDQGLNPSSVERCALQQQFRREGADYWRLELIIASLPTLIFIALLIFFVGLAEWMWNVDHNVGIIVIVTTAIGAFFYFATTLISIYSADAPFRTPVSRYLPVVIGVTLSLVPKLIKRVYTYATNDHANSISSLRESMKRIASRRVWSWSTFKGLLWSTFSLFSPLVTFESVKSREVKAVDKITDINLSSLFWLSRTISIEASQRQSFITILKAILYQEQRSKDPIDSQLWEQIFRVLHGPDGRKLSWNDYSQDELDHSVLTMKGLVSIRMGLWDKDKFKSLVGNLYKEYNDPQGMADVLLSWQDLQVKAMETKENKEMTKVEEIDPSESLPASDDHLLLGDSELVVEREGILAEGQIGSLRKTVLTSYSYALSNWKDTPPEFLVVMLEKINAIYTKISDMKVTLPESILPADGMFRLISEKLSIGLDGITNTNTIPLQILDRLQQLITANLTDSLLLPTTTEPYLYLMSRDESPKKEVVDAYEAMIQQRIARLTQLPTLSLSDDQELPNLLSTTLQMALSPLWTNISESWATQLLASIAGLDPSIWKNENRVNSARLMACAFHFKWETYDKNWNSWWVGIMLGFVDLIKSKSYKSAEALFIQYASLFLSSHLPSPDSLPDDEIDKLKKISHIGVRLFAMTVTESVEIAHSVLVDGLDKSSDEFWKPSEEWTALIDLCYSHFEKQATISEEILRALAIGSSLRLYDQIYQSNTAKLESTTDLYQYLRSPVLPAVLRHSSGRETITWKMLHMVCEHKEFSSEFVKIDGPSWLYQFVAERPIRLKEAISFIYQSTKRCYTYEDCKAWVVASSKCAESVVTAIREGKIRARELWEPISKETHLLVNELEKKPEEISVLISRSKADQIKVESDLEGLTKKDDTLSNKEMAPKDPVIKEWTQAEKQEFKNLTDKFIQEIYGILGHVLGTNISLWLDKSLVPPGDPSLLRGLMMSQPSTCALIIIHFRQDILSDSFAALSHFRAPVLEIILRECSRDTTMGILSGISRHPWFRDEFIRAKGPELVPQSLGSIYLGRAIKVINNQLPMTKDPSSILLWLILAWDCLTSVGEALSSINSSRDMRRQYTRMMRYAKEDIRTLMKQTTESMNKWKGERTRGYVLPPRFPHDPEGLCSHKSSFVPEDTNKGAVQWSAVEWEKISRLVEALIPSLERGYIIPPDPILFKRDTQFSHDPDGLCLHRSTENNSTRLRLLRQFGDFPLDTDGSYYWKRSFIMDGDGEEGDHSILHRWRRLWMR